MKKVVKKTFEIEEESGKLLDEEFIFTQLAPKVALKTSIKIAKTLGGPLGKAVGSLKRKGNTGVALDDWDMDISLLGSSVESLFSNMHEEDVMEVFEVLLTSVLYKGKQLTANSLVFEGNFGLIYKVAYKSFDVNFGDFFLKELGVYKNRPTKAAQEIQPQM